MSKQEKSQKLKLSPWRMIRFFSITFVVFEIIFYTSLQHSFWPIEESFYYYTPIVFVTSAVFCWLSISKTYYLIEGTKFLHYKMGKITDYTWNNIIYIDEEYSERKKMMVFYTKEGQEHVLAFDKEGILYKTALEKCPLISKEEFKMRFPNKKI